MIKPKEMFTIEEIKAAHAKVKSGADFPNYIKALKYLGVIGYTTFVADGHTLFNGKNADHIASQAIYEIKNINTNVDPERFKERLRIHQIEQSDYATFCNDCAATGIDRWTVDTIDMTCIYYDLAGKNILTEFIPKA